MEIPVRAVTAVSRSRETDMRLGGITCDLGHRDSRGDHNVGQFIQQVVTRGIGAFAGAPLRTDTYQRLGGFAVRYSSLSQRPSLSQLVAAVCRAERRPSARLRCISWWRELRHVRGLPAWSVRRCLDRPTR